MKMTKRIMAVLLAVFLLAALAVVPASAATDVTITDSSAGVTYKAYKVFDLVKNGSAYLYRIKNDSPFYSAVQASGYFDLYDGNSISGYTDAIKKAGFDDTVFVANIKAAIGGTAATKEVTVGSGETSAVLAGLEDGYYVITSTNGDKAFGISVPNSSSNVIAEKVAVPNISKTVSDTEVAIGDMVTYTATLAVETGGVNYVMYDKMEAGLTFGGSVTIEYAGNPVAADAYTLTLGGVGDDYTFKIAFDEAKIAYETGKSLVITYTATLNENAEIHAETNDNTVWMTHGVGTVVTGNTVSVSTFKLTVNKTDASSNPLTGATFKVDGVKVVLKEKTAGKAIYIISNAGAAVEEIEMTDFSTFEIWGLDNGTYTLVEVEAPTGYIKAQSIPNQVISSANASVTIQNSTGAELPSTGGVGTTIFYVAGLVLVLAAVTVLVSKKRANA